MPFAAVPLFWFGVRSASFPCCCTLFLALVGGANAQPQTLFFALVSGADAQPQTQIICWCELQLFVFLIEPQSSFRAFLPLARWALGVFQGLGYKINATYCVLFILCRRRRHGDLGSGAPRPRRGQAGTWHIPRLALLFLGRLSPWATSPARCFGGSQPGT